MILVCKAVYKRRQHKAEDKKRYAYAEKSDETFGHADIAALYRIWKKRCKKACDGTHNNKVYKNADGHFLSVEVLKAYHYHACKEETYQRGVDKPLLDNVEPHKGKGEKYSREAFDENISSRNFRSARTALATQKQPAEHGDKVVPFNGSTAGHTVGILLCERISRGKPVDADVQKAADADAEQEYHNKYSYVVADKIRLVIREKHKIAP